MDLQALSNEFDDLCWERHEAGAKKYGPLNFAQVDTIGEAIEEVVDMVNYMRYTYIKLRLLQIQLSVQPQEVPKLGREGFISRGGST